jgi:ABC-type hemin transport system ATPase subunit
VNHRRHYFFRRTKLVPRSLPLSLELRPGSEGIVVENAEQAQLFIECAIGLSRPRRGQVLFGSVEPSASPKLRAEVESVLPVEPEYPLGLNVEEIIKTVVALRKKNGAVYEEEPSESRLLTGLLSKDGASLTGQERRRLTLAIALCRKEPVALFLFEPLQHLSSDHADFVLERLKTFATTGSILVSLTFSRRAAARLSERVHVIARTPRPHPEEAISFIIRADRPRELAAVLTSSECVRAAHFDPKRPTQITVVTVDEMATAKAISDAICSTQTNVFEVVRVPESLHLKGAHQ